MKTRFLAVVGLGTALFVACGGVSVEVPSTAGAAGRAGESGGAAGQAQEAGRGGSAASVGGVGGVGGVAGESATAGSAGDEDGTGGSEEGGTGGEAQGGAPPFDDVDCDACGPTSDDPDCGDCPGFALRTLNGHTCLLGADRRVRCWGANEVYSQPRTYMDGASPPSTLFERISAEAGLDAGGGMVTWGYLDELGRPPRIAGPFRFIAEHGGCAVRLDGAIHCGNSVVEGQFRSLATGPSVKFCSLDLEGTVACSEPALADTPSGPFLRIAIGSTWQNQQEYAHGCGIRVDQTLACWGNDDYGQRTPPPGRYRRIASAGAYSCAIGTDGVTRCWGSYPPPPADTFVSLALDHGHGCGLREDGKVRCWGGTDSSFQLHPPPELSFETERFTSFSVAGDESHPAGEFYKLKGETHACGLRENGTLRCWGEIEEPPTGEFVQVSSGPHSSCAIGADSTLVCWGNARAFAGLLAEGAMGGFEQVSAGAHSVCAVRTGGTLSCWKSDSPIGYVPLPPPAGTFSKVVISADTVQDFEEGEGDSYAHACALRTDGAIQCWGYEAHGAFSNPGFSEWTHPGPFVDLAVGFQGECGVRADGTAACTGLGPDPGLVELDGAFTRIAPGRDFAVVGVRSDGSLVNAADGERLLEGDFVDVSAGGDYFCGLTNDLEVRCAGSRVR
jgi:hypothetical protein